jgi:hypothetical protein
MFTIVSLLALTTRPATRVVSVNNLVHGGAEVEYSPSIIYNVA